MTTEEAVLRLREDPAWAARMRDSYLDGDLEGAAGRFERSGEFSGARALLAGAIDGANVLDLGAGTGIASRALARAGAAGVLALEPDPSAVVGLGAIARLCAGEPRVRAIAGHGEAIPLRDGVVDVVYARQVLHHARDLPRLLAECARVLRAGGLLLASREHVVDDEAQLAEFLASHPVHRLAGGEHAFSLAAYRQAIRGAGFDCVSILGPYESVINASPAVQSDDELPALARTAFLGKYGLLGHLALLLPGARERARRVLDQPTPGRLFTFLCRRP
jgi:SAM-dependent methyltransferase